MSIKRLATFVAGSAAIAAAAAAFTVVPAQASVDQSGVASSFCVQYGGSYCKADI